MKKKKIIIIMITVILLICISAIIVVTLINDKDTKNIKKDGMLNILFPKEKQSTLEYMESYIQEDGRAIKCDGYTFTLVRTLYDCTTGIGCVEMVVEKDDGSIPRLTIGDVHYKGVGVDERFDIRTTPPEKAEYKEYEDKVVIYVYYDDMSNNTDNKIGIYDYSNRSKDVLEEYVDGFELIDSGFSVMCGKSDGIHVYVTPFGIREDFRKLDNIEMISRDNISINWKNGKTTQLMKDGKFVEGNLAYYNAASDSISTETFYGTENLINVNKVASIKIADKVLERVDK